MKPSRPIDLRHLKLDWQRFIPALGRANRAIAGLNGSLIHLEAPDLLMTPLTTREAVLSSKIEGTVVTVDEVLRSQAGDEPEQESKRLDIEEVVNYRKALDTARGSLKKRPFCLNLVLDLHKILLTSVRGQNKAPGAFRRVQNYIGRPGSSIEQAEFVPPSPEVLLPALGEWEKYYHDDAVDPLVQLALIHAQFEFLHPFLDGNGRIGRILIPLFLYDKEILSSPSFYLSEFLEENRETYIDRLRHLQRQPDGWNQWCLFFLEGLTLQAERNQARVKAIVDLYKKLKTKMLSIKDSRSTVPLLDAMFTQPIFQAGFLVGLPGLPQRPQLMRLLSALVEGKVLKILVMGSGRRPTVYSLHDLVKLCDQAPAQIGKKRSGSSIKRISVNAI